MKKLLSACLSVLLILLCCPVSVFAAEDTTVFATANSTEIQYAGDGSDVFRTAVELELGDSESGIAAYVVTVTWDPDVLELTDGGIYFEDLYSEGYSMIPDGSTVVNTQNVAEGSVTVSSGSVYNRASSDGVLFLLEFRPKNVTAETKVTVTLGSKNVTAENALSSEDKRITNVTEETSLTLSVSERKTLRGDINGDGAINATDYILLKRHVLRSHTLADGQRQAADINSDGRINATDYILLKRHVLKTYTIVQ